MKPLKVQFHVHTSEDPVDHPKHTPEQMLDFAAEKKYDVVAMTHHDSFFFNDEIKAYAEKLGILLVPGIEKTVARRHVLIINATKDAENIHTFYDLCKYRKSHPDCLVIAAHPYYPRGFCLQEKLLENINLFDAIEDSWFHTEKLNMFNKRAEKIAKLHKKAFIGTSDNHILQYFDQNYSLVHAEKNWKSIREAILANKIESKPTPLTMSEFMKVTVTMITEFDIP
ncbi:hypothetical protein KAZ92_00780, partial [Candidatus Gracilibacteria bacterium]|nr:hypothetical protein [Candidatus Gracilibacteria bacterium]